MLWNWSATLDVSPGGQAPAVSGTRSSSVTRNTSRRMGVLLARKTNERQPEVVHTVAGRGYRVPHATAPARRRRPRPRRVHTRPGAGRHAEVAAWPRRDDVCRRRDPGEHDGRD